MNRIFTFCRGKTFTRVNYLFSSWKRDKRIQLKENSLCNGCLCIPCSAGLETIILFWLSRSKSGRFRSKSISNKCSVHQGFNLAAQTIFKSQGGFSFVMDFVCKQNGRYFSTDWNRTLFCLTFRKYEQLWFVSIS